MFKAHRQVAPRATAPHVAAETSPPDPAPSAGYDTGVRQALDEHRGFAALAGVIMIVIGGTMIASEQRDASSRRLETWACTDPTGDDAGTCPMKWAAPAAEVAIDVCDAGAACDANEDCDALDPPHAGVERSE